MHAILDHHLLGIEDIALDTGKTYQHDFQSYSIADKNKLLFVLHKKEIKLMELKNIGSTMGVFYIKERPPFLQLNLVTEEVQFAGQHFGGFDEETGERYHFFPAFPTARVEVTNKIFSQLHIPFQLQQTAKGVVAPRKNISELPTDGSVEQLLSHFFGLTLLYGKFEAREGQLNSIKIQLPLTNAYLGLQEVLEQSIQHLQHSGIFLQSSLNVQQGKSTLQITSNDWELLQIFANWYKEIENFQQITKKEQTAQAVQQLKAFLDAEGFENTEEVKTRIDKGIVKILVK